MGTFTSRRAVLRAITVAMIAVLPGCSGIVQSLTGLPPDVVVFNKTNQNRKAKVTIRNRPTGKTVLSKTPSIPAGGAAEYPDILAPSGRYTMTVKTEDGLTNSHQWNVSSDNQSIQTIIKTNSITFREVSP